LHACEALHAASIASIAQQHSGDGNATLCYASSMLPYLEAREYEFKHHSTSTQVVNMRRKRQEGQEAQGSLSVSVSVSVCLSLSAAKNKYEVRGELVSWQALPHWRRRREKSLKAALI
jgi:hypothetical protein